MKEPVNQPSDDMTKCNDAANDMLQCLNLRGGKVARVCVKKVSLDIELDNDCKCD
jgi:hypothetical protein